MFRRTALALAIFSVASLVAVPGWIALNSEDLEEVADGDLLVQGPAVAPDPNPYDHFSKAAESLERPEDADERLLRIRTEGRDDPG